MDEEPYDAWDAETVRRELEDAPPWQGSLEELIVLIEECTN